MRAGPHVARRRAQFIHDIKRAAEERKMTPSELLFEIADCWLAERRCAAHGHGRASAMGDEMPSGGEADR